MRSTKILSVILMLVIIAAPGCKKKAKVKEDKYSGYTNEELYKIGAAYAKKGKNMKAQEHLREIVKRSYEDEITPKAVILLADSYYEQGTINSYADAVYYYRHLMRYYPRYPRTDYCRYQIGMCFFEQRNAPDKDLTPVEQAIDSFKKVASHHPDSLYVGPARKKLRNCYQILAEHEFIIGEFYYKKGAFEAAADRFEVVLNKYSDYYEEPGLYYFAGQAYWDMDRKKDGEYYFTKLIRRFPESKYAKEARQRLEGKPSPLGFWNKILPPYY